MYYNYLIEVTRVKLTSTSPFNPGLKKQVSGSVRPRHAVRRSENDMALVCSLAKSVTTTKLAPYRLSKPEGLVGDVNESDDCDVDLKDAEDHIRAVPISFPVCRANASMLSPGNYYVSKLLYF